MNEITKKIMYNFGGAILPIGLGVLLIPFLLDRLGTEKFGLLSIGWMIVGYFGILDMGIGRSLTQKISENIGQGKTESIGYFTKVSVYVVGLLGIVGTIIVLFLANYLTTDVFKVKGQLIEETIFGFKVIAFAVPVVLMTTVLFGALEGLQLFKLSNLIRAPLNSLMFIMPAGTAIYNDNLAFIFGSLLITRIIILFVLLFVVNKLQIIIKNISKDIEGLKCIFKSGGWVSISNFVSPMMVYFDRFYIPYALGLGFVAYYTTPLDILLKTLLIPASIMSVLFTKFAQDWKVNYKNVEKNFKVSLCYISVIMLPIPVICCLFGRDILTIWLGSDFAKEAYVVMSILSIGIFFNGLAVVPFFLLQGIGRPDVSAKIHVVELPLYALMVFVLTNQYSLNGVAIAWILRVIIDFFLQSILVLRLIKQQEVV